MMLGHGTDRNPQARSVLFDPPARIPALPERHYFVADDTGHYCAACNLPERNRRHAPRAVA